MAGFEPAVTRVGIWCSIQLSYTRIWRSGWELNPHLRSCKPSPETIRPPDPFEIFHLLMTGMNARISDIKYFIVLVRMAGLEPATPRSVIWCSNPLSYIRIWRSGRESNPHLQFCRLAPDPFGHRTLLKSLHRFHLHLARVAGFEPAVSRFVIWRFIQLNHTRIDSCYLLHPILIKPLTDSSQIAAACGDRFSKYYVFGNRR